MLPESIFTSLNGAKQQEAGKPQPAWIQTQSQRRGEITNWCNQAQQSTYQQNSTKKSLNQSLGKASSFVDSRSPYTPIPQQSIGGANFIGTNDNETDTTSKFNRKPKQNKLLNSSLSIENERNRIQDVVNSSSFGPQIASQQNGIFGRSDCHNSPQYHQSGAEQDFSSKKQPKTTVSRSNNTNHLISSGTFAEESSQKASTVTNSLHGVMNQNTSTKGIPQINNMQNFTAQLQQQQLQAQQNQKNIHRGLYSTTTNNKYNFITPMILSDLHQISSIQQTRSEFAQEDLKQEESKILTPGSHDKNAPCIEYDSNQRNERGNISQEGHKMSLKSAQITYQNNKSRQIAAEEKLLHSTTIASQNKEYLQSRSMVSEKPEQRHFEHFRPQSGHFKRQLAPSSGSQTGIKVQNKAIITTDSIQKLKSQNTFNHELNLPLNPDTLLQQQYPQQQPLPTFKHSKRHLKTPAMPHSSSHPPKQQQLKYSEPSGVTSMGSQGIGKIKMGGGEPEGVLMMPDSAYEMSKSGRNNNFRLPVPSQKNAKQAQMSTSSVASNNSQERFIGHEQSNIRTVAQQKLNQAKRSVVEGHPDVINKRATPKTRGLKTRNTKPGRSTHLKKSKGKAHHNLKRDASSLEGIVAQIKGQGALQICKVAESALEDHSYQNPLHEIASQYDEIVVSPESQLQQQQNETTFNASQCKIETVYHDVAEAVKCVSSQSQHELHNEDLDWSMASILSSYQSKISEEKGKALLETAKIKDTLKQPEMNQNGKDKQEESKKSQAQSDDKVQEQKSGEKVHKEEQSEAQTKSLTSDYFNENRLAIFNKIALERDKISTDPHMFALHKVRTFLTQNPLNQRFLQKTKGALPNSVFKPHANQVTFLKSIFEGRPPVAFFQYPSYVGIRRVADRIRMYTREEVEHLFMSFRISDSAHIYNAVVNSCKSAGFQMLESNNTNLFNLQWTGYIGANDIKNLNKYQKTNHFPGSSQLGRKDLLWRNMSRMRSKFPKDFVITPMSYLVNEEYEAFQAERDRDPSAFWILKPVAASCGRGIKIYNSTQRVSKKEGYLGAKYIANPHLLNGLKYDLRVYVLVTSFNPLRIYMYNDGLVRFATEKYSNDPRKLQKKYVHLTNFSINKKSLNFVKNNDAKRNKQGNNSAGGVVGGTDEDQQEFDQNQSKWDFKMLRQAYEKQGINYEYVIAQFKDLIVKTLLCVEPHITQNLQKNPTSRVNCFELYGFDILVDQNHKPWVLEVNVLPSLSSSSPFDKRIKTMLICDTLTLVGIRGYDKQKFHSQTTELLGLAPFAQSMTVSELRQKPRLSGHERLSKDEVEMLMDLDEEFMRRGNFQRIFPLASNAAFYDQFFETKRYQNALCASYLTSPQHIRDQLLYKYRRVYNSQV